MYKTTLKVFLSFTAILFMSCSSEENSTTPETVNDSRLPDQEVFKPAIQLVPKTLLNTTAKSTAKSAETSNKHLTSEISYRISKDNLGNEIESNPSENRYSYDNKGRLQSIDRYRNNAFVGNISKFDFNDANKVIKTYYADIVAEINNGGFISKVTSTDGTVTDIFYDEIGRDIKEVENGTYKVYLDEIDKNGNLTNQTAYVNEQKTTYIYSYKGNKVFVNIEMNQKKYPRIVKDNQYEFKDKTTTITYELTVDYTKAGIYSSEPIFRCYIYNWMHILDWKTKSVSEGITEYEMRYDYEYIYDEDGYLKQSKRTTTNILNPNSPLSITKTNYWYK